MHRLSRGGCKRAIGGRGTAGLAIADNEIGDGGCMGRYANNDGSQRDSGAAQRDQEGYISTTTVVVLLLVATMALLGAHELAVVVAQSGG